MSNKPKLSDLVDALEMVSSSDMGECCAYLDKLSGELFHVNDDELSAAAEDDNDDDDLDDMDEMTDENPINPDSNWRAEEISEHRYKAAIQAIANDDGSEFVMLPDSFDIHEYSIMAEFCHSLENQEIREIMTAAIRGSGAFGRFKQLIRKHGILDDWFAFQKDAYRNIIIEWCEAEGIEYVDD